MNKNDSEDFTPEQEAEEEEECLLMDLPRIQKSAPGSSPGMDYKDLLNLPSSGERAYITCTDYSADQIVMRDIIDLDEFINSHRPEWVNVRWINIDGLGDMKLISEIARKYQLHPLAIEDLLHVPQRPKMEGFVSSSEHAARLFVIARMVRFQDEELNFEQVSMFLGHNTLITFQQSRGDVWDPIRHRLNRAQSRLRSNDASFLLYALLDAITDHCFPILEHYSDRLEDLEQLVIDEPTQQTMHQIHAVKRELLLLRREAWPMRELVSTLLREPHPCVSENTHTYLRDVYDHSVQIIDLLETQREVAGHLAETYMSTVSLRMNEVMKVLTMIATIFIPLSFLAGIYGMNFEHMPELAQPWAYPAFWIITLSAAIGMMVWFRRRNWW